MRDGDESSVCVTDASLLYTFVSFARGDATTMRYGPPTLSDLAAFCTFVDILVLYDRVLILRGTPSSDYFFDEMFDDDWDAEYGDFLQEVRSLVVVQPLPGLRFQWNDALFLRLIDDDFFQAVQQLPLDGWLGAPYRRVELVDEELDLVWIVTERRHGKQSYLVPSGSSDVRKMDHETLRKFLFLLGGTISSRYAATHGFDHVPHPLRNDERLTSAVNTAYPVIHVDQWPHNLYREFVREMSAAILATASASTIERQALGPTPLFYLYFMNRANGDVTQMWSELVSFRRSALGGAFRSWWRRLRGLSRRGDVAGLASELSTVRREADDLRREIGLDVVTSDVTGIANVGKPLLLEKSLEFLAKRYPLSASCFRVLNASPRYIVARDTTSLIRRNRKLFVFPNGYFHGKLRSA
jgi:hypothetical protein